MSSDDNGSDTLAQALAYAARGWPVFPCHEGAKTPATRHGCLDATTDPRRIRAWWGSQPGWNLAIATGTPGPDVLDVDQHGPNRNGFAAFRRLRAAGMLGGAAQLVRTPSGGLHVYFAGTSQHNGKLTGQHLDFRSAGGYVVAPPSTVGGKPYQVIKAGAAVVDELSWDAVCRLLAPERFRPRPAGGPAMPDGGRLDALARWVSGLAEGNRNDGLFWAACRALDDDPATDLAGLAAAAAGTGLDDREIARTLDSARRTQRQVPDRGAA
jgi:hypothetical protein